jgi:hypothetical protein
MIAQQRQRIFAAVERGVDIDAHHALPILMLQAFHAAERTDTGIVDQHRQSTHDRVRLFQHVPPPRFDDDILNRGPRRLGVQLRIDAVGQRTDRSRVAVGEKHLRTMARQHTGHRGTETAGGAGDQCLLAGDPPC